MARNKHVKSGYKLRRLPSCPKCRGELALVAICYDEDPKIHDEWECIKCHKHFSRGTVQEPEIPADENWLHEWCLKNQKRDQKKTYIIYRNDDEKPIIKIV